MRQRVGSVDRGSVGGWNPQPSPTRRRTRHARAVPPGRPQPADFLPNQDGLPPPRQSGGTAARGPRRLGPTATTDGTGWEKKRRVHGDRHDIGRPAAGRGPERVVIRLQATSADGHAVVGDPRLHRRAVPASRQPVPRPHCETTRPEIPGLRRNHRRGSPGLPRSPSPTSSTIVTRETVPKPLG